MPVDAAGAMAIRLVGVAKRFGKRGQIEGLRGVDLEIRKGEFVAIMGPSGSGKSTLLSILGLLDSPTEGTVELLGIDTAKLSESQKDVLRGERLGFVFQNSYLVNDESASSNATLGLRIRGVPAKARRQRAVAALEAMGLSALADAKARTMSGGERQRVALARALVASPELVLADEPTGALDSESSRSIVGLFRQTSERGTTVVVVTHDPLVAAAADRTLVLRDGVLRDVYGQDGATAQRRSPESRPSARTRRRRLAMDVWSALDGVVARPGKSILVSLAYGLGVAALVLSVALAQAATGQVARRLLDSASSVLTVSTASADSSFYLPSGEGSASALLQAHPDVNEAFPVITFARDDVAVTLLKPPTGLSDARFSGLIKVCDEEYLRLRGADLLVDGSAEMLSNSWSGSVAVLGSLAARQLGIGGAGDGYQIYVDGRSVPVVGILADVPGETDVNATVVLSFGVLTWLNAVRSNEEVFVIPEAGRAEPLADALAVTLSPGNPGEITVSNPSRLATLQAGVTNDLSGLMSSLGWVILCLSTLTAGVVTLLSVQHRAPEIALRRALGGSAFGVWRLFSVEGVLLGLMGGALGGVLGASMSAVISSTRGWCPAIGPTVLATGIGIGLAAGALASAYPAVHAARQSPAAILRGA